MGGQEHGPKDAAVGNAKTQVVFSGLQQVGDIQGERTFDTDFWPVFTGIFSVEPHLHGGASHIFVADEENTFPGFFRQSSALNFTRKSTGTTGMICWSSEGGIATGIPPAAGAS